jgi:hypothetical protein
MYRYHVNLGFPIASAGSQVSARALRAVDRDEPEADVDRWWLLGPPQLDPSERVILLDIEPDEDGSASVALITNLEEADAPACVYVRYSRGTLPQFLVWKYPAVGSYVVALEPSTSDDDGRATASAHGTLTTLERGESRGYWVEIGVSRTWPPTRFG